MMVIIRVDICLPLSHSNIIYNGALVSGKRFCVVVGGEIDKFDRANSEL